MIVAFYRKYIPAAWRDEVYRKFLKPILPVVRDIRLMCKAKYIFLFRNYLSKTEFNQAYAFMGQHGLTPFPYPFSLKYRKLDIPCFRDENHFPYVIHNQHKLYFPKDWSEKQTVKAYRQLLIEQDKQSAHCYIESPADLEGCTLLDIGSAEGIFALNAIDRVEYVYLFECNERWISALELTFAPWKEKVSIIRKYVGGIVDDQSVTIDAFLADKIFSKLFLKMDIEGAELAALQGAQQTLLSAENVICSICVYHKKEDPMTLKKNLEQQGYTTAFTNGYIFYLYSFRKGVIRAKR